MSERDILGAHRGHIDLAREATEAGLVVTQLMPMLCRVDDEVDIEYRIQLWSADGRLWAEGAHESAERVREYIHGYIERRAT